MSEDILPCGCNANFSIVQYRYDDPEGWDGYSEKVCNRCGKRFGRWSGRELVGDEREPKALRYRRVNQRKEVLK